MWLIILLVALAMLVAGVIYISACFSHFGFVEKLSGESTKKKKLFGFLCTALLGTVLTVTLGFVNAVICIVNLMLVMALTGLIAFIVRKAAKKERKHYIEGYIALAATAVYLCVGYYFANNVWQTDYDLKTDKDIQSLRIVQFADSHIGTTFDGEGLNEYIDRINEQNPDVVVITGDFIDDSTSDEDMRAACKALSRLETKYGVYFCFGNHDKGYYSGNTADALTAEMKENGVTVLKDEYVLLDDRFYIIGRADKSEESEKRGGTRKSIAELVKDLDTSKYMIVLDHQPNDYDNEADAKVDLVLSGHTHGGQMIPVNRIGELIGANDFTYGYERRKDTDFIVTSGISDWAISFKTGCRSEYVVIDIEQK